MRVRQSLAIQSEAKNLDKHQLSNTKPHTRRALNEALIRDFKARKAYAH